MLLIKLYEKIREKLHQDPVEKLREGGALIGDNVHIYDGGGASIDYGFCHLLIIGNNVTLSNTTLLFHDASINKQLHYVKLGKIVIENNVFVGAGSIILPNVHIGNNVVIGAGSVVSKDIPDGVVAVGNPIRIIGTYDAYMDKCRRLIEIKPCFDENRMMSDKSGVREEIMDWGFIGGKL